MLEFAYHRRHLGGWNRGDRDVDPLLRGLEPASAKTRRDPGRFGRRVPQIYGDTTTDQRERRRGSDEPCSYH
ncbi:hypothetical protein SFR_1820 [Streptomyces sp. FR-008]|nr:hypothetical protein SFR_1820 [Streptomyces sp. FR-008]